MQHSTAHFIFPLQAHTHTQTIHTTHTHTHTCAPCQSGAHVGIGESYSKQTNSKEVVDGTLVWHLLSLELPPCLPKIFAFCLRDITNWLATDPR